MTWPFPTFSPSSRVWLRVPASERKASSSRTSQPEASTDSSVVLEYTRVVA